MLKTRASSPPGETLEHFQRWQYGLPFDIPLRTDTFTADRIYYSPFQIKVGLTVRGIIVINAALVGTDSLVAALYDSGGVPIAPVNRLAMSAAILTVGAAQRQYFPFTTPVAVTPGLYYGCIWTDGNTDSLYCLNLNYWLIPTGLDDHPQWYYEGNAGGPQPVATPLAAASDYLTRYLILRTNIP